MADTHPITTVTYVAIGPDGRVLNVPNITAELAAQWEAAGYRIETRVIDRLVPVFGTLRRGFSREGVE